MGHDTQIPRARRLIMFEAQKGLCMYCGRPMLTDKADRDKPDYCTTDHVIARVYDDRPHYLREIVAACQRCNQLKGHGSLPVLLLRLNQLRTVTGAIGAP